MAISNSPPFSNSAVDGYAFRCDPTDASEKKVLDLKEGRSAAGHPFSEVLGSGEALRIFTGAVLPSGADTVVLQEDISFLNGKISFFNSLKPGSNTRLVGEDLQTGQLIASKGDRLTTFMAASSISAGIKEAKVYKRLSVGVFSTGDELIDFQQNLNAGSVFDVNSPMLTSLFSKWGVQVTELGKVPDNLETLRNNLNEASETFDVLITSGGASAGAVSYTHLTLPTRLMV